MSKNTKIYLTLVVWSAVALLLLSPDSPLHGPWDHCDSAIFYMCGKALMNGLRPYVDFTDSKGPLLWLFYGIGYLLSPRSYTGVYVVSVFVYAGIFYYNYKTALLLLKDEGRSWAVTLLMTVAYFWPWFHFEVRAEDFATLPVAVSLYYLFRVLYGSGDAAAQPAVRRVGLVLGGCFMALVLIKYNIAAMQGIIILIVLWHVLRTQRKSVLPLTGWLAAGACIVAAPFLLYLWLRGAVPTFIQEYFINTFSTIDLDYKGNQVRSDQDWLSFSKQWQNPVFLGITVIGSVLLAFRLKRYRFVPLLTSVFFFFLASFRNLGYYYVICHIFVLFLFVWLFGFSRKPLKRHWLWIIFIGVLGWSVNENFGDTKLENVTLWSEHDMAAAYSNISAAMDGSDKPRMMCLFGQDLGFGLWNEALPAGKHWMQQYGATAEMNQSHRNLFETCRADYVIVIDELKASMSGYTPGYILSFGYARVLREEYSLFKNKETMTIAVYKKNEH